MFKHKDKKEQRRKRHLRVRSAVSGTSERPRLAVFRSEKHIYAQLIDDSKGVTLVAASTVDKEIRGSVEKSWNVDAAEKGWGSSSQRRRKTRESPAWSSTVEDSSSMEESSHLPRALEQLD